MAPKSMIPLFCTLLMASAGAFDIMEILKPHSEYSTFTKLLTDTKLADEINSRQTITVLALDNSAVGAITSLPSNLQKDALSLHVILDYYDPVELATLKKKSVQLTTLFQASGKATAQTGFLSYTELPNEQQFFGSAVPGAQLDSNLIKVVDARPYNISVMQVSKAIIPPGLDGPAKAPSTPASNASSPTPAQKPSQSPASAPSSGGNTVTPPSESVPAPSGSTTAPAPTSNDASPPTNSGTTSPSAGEANSPSSGDETTPTEAPTAEEEGPTTDGGPAASSPVPKGGPASDAPVPADSDKTSSAGKVVARTGLALLVMGLMLFVPL